MAVRIVRLGSPRHAGEGVRLGTVRRPPRGVPKSRFAAENWYDVWLPNLAPSAPLVASARTIATDQAAWKRLAKCYEAEMAKPENSRVLDTLATLSQRTNFSVGCYCEDEHRCHRSVLGTILKRHGAKIAGQK
jgi:uncharacterized protein YeaO (DUF488 family)